MVEFGSGTERQYAALIGDVVSSRHASDRRALQRRLIQEIDALNDRWSSALVTPLTLLRGDEVQGLVRRPEIVVDLVVGLSEAIFPELLLFGLGYGTLSTEVDRDIGNIDGPCFHRARSALQGVKRAGWLGALGFGPADDAVLTALFTLMSAIRARWTDKQLAYARAARRMPQKRVAKELGVSPSTVSESLKASSFAALEQGEEAAKLLLRQFGSRGELTRNSVQ